MLELIESANTFLKSLIRKNKSNELKIVLTRGHIQGIDLLCKLTKKPTQPSLGFILMQVMEWGLRFSSTNLDTTLFYDCATPNPILEGKPGEKFLISPDTFSKAKSLKSDTMITLKNEMAEIIEDRWVETERIVTEAEYLYTTQVETIQSSSPGLRLVNLQKNACVDQYPVQDIDISVNNRNTQTIEVPDHFLVNTIEDLKCCLSKDSSQHILQSYYFTNVRGFLESVAINGHVCGWCKCDASFDDEIEFNVRSEALDLLKPILKKNKGSLIEVAWNCKGDEQDDFQYLSDRLKYVSFRVGNFTIVSRQREGAYPKHQMLIPSEHQLSKSIDFEDPIATSKVLLKDFKDVHRKTVILTIQKGTIVATDEKNEVTVQIPGTGSYDGQIAFNSEYLGNSLRISGGSLKMIYEREDSPAISLGKNSNVLIMPVKLR